MLVVSCALGVAAGAASGAVSQQGPPLSSGSPPNEMGFSVALSADGDTAVVGGPYANSYSGAVWVFVRSGGAWTEQAMLMPTDEEGQAQFGESVALSSDGNTALIGGPGQDLGTFGTATEQLGVGTAWVFTRSGSTWTQDGSNLGGGGSGCLSQVGYAVALSGNGDTALVNGNSCNLGEVLVYARQGDGTWQSQTVLPGNDAYPYPEASFGRCGFAISQDGLTALFGTEVWTSQGGTWSKQGDLPVTSGCGGVSLSANADTALLSTPAGPVVVSRAGPGAPWSQQGPPLAAWDATPVNFGSRLALSADGSTVLASSSSGTQSGGAAWMFRWSGSSWMPEAELTPSDAGAPFAASLALSGDGSTALVGGGGTEAYVFTDVPSVTSIGPAAGSTAGDNRVTITGTDLGGATSVRFGSAPARSFTVESPTELVAVSPSVPQPGAVNVTVSAASGTSPPTTDSSFTYVSPLVTIAAGALVRTPRGDELTLSCAREICSGTVSLWHVTTRSGHRRAAVRTLLGRGRYYLLAGQRRAVIVALTAAGRRAAAGNGVHASAEVAALGATAVSRAVRLP